MRVTNLTWGGSSRIALCRSEERFRLLADAVQNYAIFMLDAHGRVSTWNKGAERMKGYKNSEIIGMHFSVFYPEEDRLACKPERELEIAAKEGQDEERRGIGGDLHDSVGQYLVALKMKLDSLSSGVVRNQFNAGALAECVQLTEEALKEVRTVSYLLYPPLLEELGLKSAVPWYLDGFTKLRNQNRPADCAEVWPHVSRSGGSLVPRTSGESDECSSSLRQPGGDGSAGKQERNCHSPNHRPGKWHSTGRFGPSRARRDGRDRRGIAWHEGADQPTGRHLGGVL
jgi:PAS domain S-box-containing protein